MLERVEKFQLASKTQLSTDLTLLPGISHPVFAQAYQTKG
jgi:hypothetical protein